MWPFIWTGLLLACVAATSANASPDRSDQACAGSQILVHTDDAQLFDLICTTARDASALLAECGLAQTRPIDVHPTDHLIHAGGTCLATFDCATDRLNIVRPPALTTSIPEDGPYRLLPPETVFRALLVHELAHAYLHQSGSEGEISPVDQEYVAAVMELTSLSPEHRRILLEANPISPPVHAEAIDILIYLMAPRRFAVASWLHFQDHGCDVVRAIVSGSFTFDQPPQ